MSASEKLKALGQTAAEPWNHDLDGVELLEVLPQIVAVVEAAEKFTPARFAPSVVEPLRAALSALDEALK